MSLVINVLLQYELHLREVHAELQAEIILGAADCAGDLSQGHVSLDVE